MKLEKKVKKKLEDLGIFLLSGFLIGIATYNFASAFSFPMVGFTGIGLIGYHLFGIPIGMTVVCLNIPMALISWKILGREFLEKSILYCKCCFFYRLYCTIVSEIYWRNASGSFVYSDFIRNWLCSNVYKKCIKRWD